jgi:acyl-CoA synthetase (AMP-forming)/AMP-acid ligase II
LDGAIQTIPGAVRAAAETFGDAVAIAEPGGPTLSYSELHDHVRVAARALIAAGVGPGDRVAIWSPNTHHWVIAGLGVLYAGATLVPVNTRFTGPEALDVLTRSRARVLFVVGPFVGADRHALLAAAAAESRADLPGLVVQIPVESGRQPSCAGRPGAPTGWAEFLAMADRIPAGAAEERAASVTAEDVSATPGTRRRQGMGRLRAADQRRSVPDPQPVLS